MGFTEEQLVDDGLGNSARLVDELARARCRSLHRLAGLPEDTAMWPTHRAGSFCSAPPGALHTSTVGAEKTGNPLLTAPDEDTFVHRLLAGLGSYPAYLCRPAQLNRAGPALLPAVLDLAPLPVGEVRRLLGRGVRLVGVRPVERSAAGYIPGAVPVELGALPGGSGALARGAVVMCGHGERAVAVASILERTGVDDVAVLVGGPADRAEATGRPLEEGR